MENYYNQENNPVFVPKKFSGKIRVSNKITIKDLDSNENFLNMIRKMLSEEGRKELEKGKPTEIYPYFNYKFGSGEIQMSGVWSNVVSGHWHT